MSTENTENKAFTFAPKLTHAEILTNPILDIAARFWLSERYEAFKICYRSMRVIDDLIDEKKTTGPIDARDAAKLKEKIEEWLKVTRSDGKSGDAFRTEFVSTMKKFKIPIWPWERLAAAMNFDLTHNGFSSFTEFIRYSVGAAIAPAAVFMHLCGVRKVGALYHPPSFDIKRAARPLALFSYLVHTVRDFQKDQRAGLNNFPDDLTRKYGLTKGDLIEIANGKAVSEEFRSLMRAYVKFIGFYQSKARVMIDMVAPELDERARLSLEVIYSLYTQIFERIIVEDGTFNAGELNPSAKEVEARLASVVLAFKL